MRNPLPDIVRYACEHSRFYRELYRQHGITTDNLAEVAYQDLPIISKRDIIEHFDDIVTLEGVTRAKIMQLKAEKSNVEIIRQYGFLPVFTSGTSTHKGLIVYDVKALQAVATSLGTRIENEYVRNLTRRVKMMYIGVLGKDLAGEILAGLSASDNVEVKLLDVRIGYQQLAEQIKAFAPDAVACYATTMHHLAKYVIANHLELSIPHIKLSALPLTPQMHQDIIDAFQATVYDLYIATENLAAFGLKKKPGQHFELFAETAMIEPLIGTGNMILTNLYNYAFPLIRYQTEDLIEVSHDHHHKPQIVAVTGRDIYHLPIYHQGLQIGKIEAMQLYSLMLGQNIANMQLIVRGNKVELYYISAENFNSNLAKAFNNLLKNNQFENLIELSIHNVEHIEQNQITGKVDFVIDKTLVDAAIIPTQPYCFHPAHHPQTIAI